MPNLHALRSSSRTNVAGVQAKLLFFARPTGDAFAIALRYSSTFWVRKSSVPNAKFNAPNPRLPTAAAVSGFEHAANIGGCGCWIGLGMICVGGILKNFPSWENTSELHMRGIISTA